MRLGRWNAVAGGAVLALAFAITVWALLIPTGGGTIRVVEIRPGTSIRGIAAALQRARVIRSGAAFVLLARVMRRPLQAGEYGFGRVNALTVLSALQEGRVLLHRFLVREGAAVHEIARELDRSGLARADRFELACADGSLLASLGISAGSAEGYLFPDTYHLPRGLPERRIVGDMVRRFFERLPEGIVEAGRRHGRSLHEIVTLASIVEKEARVPEERPVIAGVFANRLKKGMKLQADPTVLYALRRWDERLTFRDLRLAHPYNTYHRRGLPPGPICSPGLASLKAAAEPADVPYLYFVTRKDGTFRHEFSRTSREHLRAVEESRRRAKERDDGPRG